MAKSLRRSQSTSKRKSSSKSKRRTANSALNLKSAKNKKNNAKSNKSFVAIFYEQSWLSEILAVFLFIGVTFVTISFLSEFLFTSGAESGNLMGSVGKVISVLVGGFFGWAIFLPLFAVTLIALHLWSISSESENLLQLNIKSFPLLLLGGFLLTVSSSSLSSVFFGRVGGGDIGVLISKPLVEYTDLSGSILIISGFFILSITCILQKSSKDVFFSALSNICNLAVISFDVLLRTFSLLFGFTKNLLHKISFIEFTKAYDYEDEEEEGDGEELKLKPVLRKNKLDEKKWLVKENMQDVLVSRRKRNKTVSIGNKKAVINNTPYIIPASNLLNPHVEEPVQEDDEILKQKSFVIEQKLADFGIKGRVTEVHPGPVITLFEFEPAPGVKVGKIAALQDDLAMSLKAAAIRIIAPLPKKGTVGIEVPNKRRELVTLREIIESETFVKAENPLIIALGKDTYGDPVAIDIASMPHLLIAGATGTGKSVCINTLLLSLLFRSTPEELGLILIDPKILELSVYEGIPHLKVPVVTVPKQARAVLEWAVKEMDRRYRLMQKYGVRSISGYNQLVKGELAEEELANEDEAFGVEVKPLGVSEEENDRTIAKEELKPLSKLVIVIDELADLMLSVGKDIEDLIARLAQKARAAGIHLIVATQRPSVDVITGLIKANFPARVSFRVSSRVDSRTILDSMGAEKLLGMGDMLYLLPGFIGAQRAHGAFVSDDEVKKVIEKIKNQAPPQYDREIMNACEKALQEDNSTKSGTTEDEEYDELYDKVLEFVMNQGSASTSSVQRAFRIGYNRAARIIDTMEREGIIGPVNGAKPREIIIEGYEYSNEE